MATVRRTESARDTGYQLEHHLYKRVTHATPQIQTTAGKIVYLGVLPADCLPKECIVRINTSFDGLFVIGTSSNTAAVVSTADVAAGEADTYVVDRYYGTRSTVDVPLYVQLSTGSTVGEADIWLSYNIAK